MVRRLIFALLAKALKNSSINSISKSPHFWDINSKSYEKYGLPPKSITHSTKFIQKGNPFLGICIGMQALFEKSYEFGVHDGLGYIKGVVKRFSDELIMKGMKIPHTGWNSVHFKENHPVFKDIKQDSYFYFVHSFYGECADEKNIQGRTNYGIDFVSAVTYENITGVQFHPEKSQQAGLKLMENFCNL